MRKWTQPRCWRPPLGQCANPVAPRPGVTVFTQPVNGNVTIYVVGTDGELHPFATPGQFLDDGYDPALVITVPNLGGLSVGSNAGTAVTALVTRADGAIVNSSGTFYTFAGGRTSASRRRPPWWSSGRPTRPQELRRLGGPRRHRRRYLQWCRAQRGRPGVHQLSVRYVFPSRRWSNWRRWLRRHSGCAGTSHR